jgi:hypothetical protein
MRRKKEEEEKKSKAREREREKTKEEANHCQHQRQTKRIGFWTSDTTSIQIKSVCVYA